MKDRIKYRNTRKDQKIIQTDQEKLVKSTVPWNSSINKVNTTFSILIINKKKLKEGTNQEQ